MISKTKYICVKTFQPPYHKGDYDIMKYIEGEIYPEYELPIGYLKYFEKYTIVNERKDKLKKLHNGSN
jgi:hypothetical protein